MPISKDVVIELNDSDATFDEIADYLDRNHELANSELTIAQRTNYLLL
jgi:hypothetical protein